MSKIRRVAATAGSAVLLLISGCSPSDTGAEQLAHGLAETLSSHSLGETPLAAPEAATSFDALIAPLKDYPLEVSAGEIVYDMNDAVLPLSWEWQIEGNAWEYETAVDLAYRDSQWWVQWQPDSLAPGLKPGQKLGIDARSPARAEILAEDGTPIITEREILRFGLDKTRVDDEALEDAAEEIAEATGVDPEAFVARTLASGPKAFVEAITVRPDDVDSWVSEDFDQIPGALVVSDHALLGPTSTFARELLGRAGEATAEIIESSGGEISPGDIVGISGLQKHYDSQLRGTDTVEIFTVNSSDCADPLECDPEKRTVIATLDEGRPQDLQLTIDIKLQIAAESALAQAQTGEEGAAGSALVAIRPSTGAILALANGEGNQGLNNAAVGHYPPGSTFKAVTALALLRAGLSLDETVPCPETTVVDGREFKNYDEYPEHALGEITFVEAFAESCNTALIELRDRISGDDLVSAAQSLGFAPPSGSAELGFPAFLGELTAPEAGTPFAAALIGQGETIASPLAMATVAASVQAGTTVSPYLIEGTGPQAEAATPLTEVEASSLRELMSAVVTGGTARLLADLPGAPVLAKTGTAEHGGPDAAPHAWIIGAQDDLAVAVLIEAGVGGAQTAGPILKEFLLAAQEN